MSPTPAHGADFDEFVAARSSRLLRTAYLLTRDRGLAEDVLQTALSKAWFAWGRIDGDPEPYVRRILVTTYASWWRRRWNGEQRGPPRPVDRDGPAAPAAACRRGAALLRGPYRGADRRGARLLGRHREEPERQGHGQAAGRPRLGSAPDPDIATEGTTR